MSKAKCERCGVVHDGEPYNEQEALDRAGAEIAKQIDREVMIAAGMIHAGDGGYGIGTQEAYDEFVKKRNQ